MALNYARVITTLVIPAVEAAGEYFPVSLEGRLLWQS